MHVDVSWRYLQIYSLLVLLLIFYGHSWLLLRIGFWKGINFCCLGSLWLLLGNRYRRLIALLSRWCQLSIVSTCAISIRLTGRLMNHIGASLHDDLFFITLRNLNILHRLQLLLFDFLFLPYVLHILVKRYGVIANLLLGSRLFQTWNIIILVYQLQLTLLCFLFNQILILRNRNSCWILLRSDLINFLLCNFFFINSPQILQNLLNFIHFSRLYLVSIRNHLVINLLN